MNVDLDAPITAAEYRSIERATRSWRGDGAIEHVERLGGMTNRNYKLVTVGGPVALRLPGPGSGTDIDRDAERHSAGVAADLGIGPKLLHLEDGVMVCEFIEGRTLSATDFGREPALVRRAARLLRAIHDSGVALTTRFDPVRAIIGHRTTLDDVPAGVDRLIAWARRRTPPAELVACHGDPWPANFIDSGDHLHLLDWEYSGMGDRAWDLADLAVEAALDPPATRLLLDAYAATGNDPDLTRRVEELRPVTDLLWGLWALVQERRGNTDHDFHDYGLHRLARAVARGPGGCGDHERPPG